MNSYIKLILLKYFPKFRIKFIEQSGIFDKKWYSKVNNISEHESVLHYINNGNNKAFSPSLVFYPEYYANKINRKPYLNSTYLEDYLLFGYKKRASPTPYFDELFYIKKYTDIANGDTPPLLHFMKYGWKEGRDPNPFFNTLWYIAKNPDVGFGKTNPLIHYIGTGHIEGRNPSPQFDVAWYKETYSISEKLEPLGYYLVEGKSKGHLPSQNEEGTTKGDNDNNRIFFSQTSYYHKKGPYFKEESNEKNDWIYNIKYIAYYLPQFHSIPENDEWWGKGFTEWTNVTKGIPRFEGHYQPRLPRDLGFYSLDSIDTIRKQVEIAKKYGLYGFCFHYYWFSGKRLLEKPLDLFLGDKSIDFPFCLCWANENWTRRWDGLDDEVLIKQEFTKEDLSFFIMDIERYLKDGRYIKIDGRPLIIIYRPLLIPEIRQVLAQWNEQLKQVGVKPPIWIAVQAFDMENPMEYGFDAAIEFPPHKVGKGLAPKRDLKLFDHSYQGHAFDMKDIVSNSMTYSQETDIPLIKAVFPSWDNEARKRGKGITFINSSPQLFRKWLDHASSYALKEPINDKSFVFINAWNEWAEGAYLEPDQHYGYAYLDQVKFLAKKFNLNTNYILQNHDPGTKMPLKVLVVSHDANKHGAQLIALNITKNLAEKFGVNVEVLLLDGGDLEDDFSRIAPTFNINGESIEKNEILKSHLENLFFEGYEKAIINTTVSGKIISLLSNIGIDSISLIHELPSLISEYGLENYCKSISKNTKKIIFPSTFVKDGFKQFTKLHETRIIPQGFFAYDLDEIDEVEKGALRKKLMLSDTDKLVIGVGFADLRKGIDIFIKIADWITSSKEDIHFAWIGNHDSGIFHWIQHDIAHLENNDRIHILPFTTRISEYIVDSDLFLLTSREDPFPTVVIEALAFGKPVIGFRNAGGIQEINNYGDILSLVPYLDINAMSRELTRLIYDDKAEYKRKSTIGKQIIQNNFRFDEYTFKLLSELVPEIKKISVIIPNYNYAHTIEERLTSIWNQSYPVFEIIVLDDCSTDNSLQVIETTANKYSRIIRTYENEMNSGSPFGQWLKGVEIARGDFIWIAEADDLARPTFLERLITFFDEKEVGMAYSQSSQIDEKGQPIADNYHYYTDEIDDEKWKDNYVENGKNEISKYLSIKNTILNVSSVLWRREALINPLRENIEVMKTFSVAGDWFFYITFLLNNKVGFCSESLNIHRRHKSGVTQSLDVQKHLNEIKRVHQQIKSVSKVDRELSSKMNIYLEEVEEYLLNKQ
jgi:glycosyltransferase involved in cell wall biosynthesis